MPTVTQPWVQTRNKELQCNTEAGQIDYSIDCEYPMYEINCTHSHKSLTVDEADCAEIMDQVRNDQFVKELQNRLNEAADR